MSSVVDQWTDDVATRVLEQIRAERLPLKPKRIEITEEIDSLGEAAWRLLLVLPAPLGETWDRTAVFQARRAAVSAFDGVAADDERALPGRTVALVTTDEAREQDIAEEEVPETGEDPGYDP